MLILFPFPVAFTIGIVGLSTFLVDDRCNFALLAKGFIVESCILGARNGERGVLLLLVAGCVVVFVVTVVDVGVVILIWVPAASHYLR